MAIGDSQTVLQGMSSGATQQILLLKEATAGMMNLLNTLIDQNRDKTTFLDEIFENSNNPIRDISNLPCITIPYVNRIDFEHEMTQRGFRFVRNSDFDLEEIEHQVYFIDNKDRASVFELMEKYNFIQEHKIAINPEQEMELFHGCPITDASGFTKPEASRALRLLAQKNATVSVEYHKRTGTYTLRVPREQEAKLIDTIKEMNVFKELKATESKWIESMNNYRSLVNNHIKMAGDFTPEEQCVIFDSEKPNHYIIIDNRGFEERYITPDANNQMSDNYVYRNSLNNAISAKQYSEMLSSADTKTREEAMDYHASYMKMTENRDEFDIELEKITDRMGTACMLPLKEFQKLKEEEKLAPGLVAQKALDCEIVLYQELDLLKEFSVERAPNGEIIVNHITSIAQGQTEVNHDKIDRAVTNTDAANYIDNERINERILSGIIVKSSGFALGNEDREHRGQNRNQELEHDTHKKDYRDINDNGTYRDELQNDEYRNDPTNGLHGEELAFPEKEEAFVFDEDLSFDDSNYFNE